MQRQGLVSPSVRTLKALNPLPVLLALADDAMR